MFYQLCLVENIHLWEDDGWRLATGKVVFIGGWANVWMRKDE
jgi:hypothetical protein